MKSPPKKSAIVKIAVSGGHHTPALAVLSSLVKDYGVGNNLEVVFFGHRHSMKGDQSDSLEYRQITARGYKFYDLKTPRFYRNRRPLFLINFVGGFFWALVWLIKERPRLIVSFGGYLSVPVVLAGYLLRIPAVTHEQTAGAGFANRLIARFCRKIFISFAASRNFFPKDRVYLTGNPVRAEVFEDRGFYLFNNSQKTIYITGGQQGSHAINESVKPILSKLLESFNVIHQSGASTLHDDYHALLNNARDHRFKNYVLKEHFGLDEIGSVYARADLVVSRAGANTVYELGVLNKPSLLIPLSFASHGEQSLNARLLRKTGLAAVLDENRLSPETLLAYIVRLSGQPRSKSPGCDFPRRADKEMAQQLMEFLHEEH